MWIYWVKPLEASFSLGFFYHSQSTLVDTSYKLTFIFLSIASFVWLLCTSCILILDLWVTFNEGEKKLFLFSSKKMRWNLLVYIRVKCSGFCFRNPSVTVSSHYPSNLILTSLFHAGCHFGLWNYHLYSIFWNLCLATNNLMFIYQTAYKSIVLFYKI